MSQLRQLVPAAAQPAVRDVYRRVAEATPPSWHMTPDFMVVGGQRCGTTTIFKLLAEHPQVLRPPVDKGTDYFTLHYGKGFDWYRSNFALAAPSRIRRAKSSSAVAFEACTYYMFHPLALERIARDLPNVRLVAMLRDPVERAYSAYKHEFARGFETEDNFMRALELEDERLEGEFERIAGDVTYESLPHRHHAYRRRGQFDEQMTRAYSLFPAEQIHVMDSGLFFADPADEYRRLVEFLHLDPYTPAAFPRHNARPGAPIPEDARAFLSEHYRAHNERLAPLIGRTPSWA